MQEVSDPFENNKGIGELLTEGDGACLRNKLCLGVGLSDQRLCKTVAQSEMYVNSYGGFDGECYDS